MLSSASPLSSSSKCTIRHAVSASLSKCYRFIALLPSKNGNYAAWICLFTCHASIYPHKSPFILFFKKKMFFWFGFRNQYPLLKLDSTRKRIRFYAHGLEIVVARFLYRERVEVTKKVDVVSLPWFANKTFYESGLFVISASLSNTGFHHEGEFTAMVEWRCQKPVRLFTKCVWEQCVECLHPACVVTYW